MKDAPDPALLTPELLLRGYSLGIFPMAEGREDTEVFWVNPRLRGILPLEGFHMSRSLRRRMRGAGLSATLDADFDAVLAGCANREETWINDAIAGAYRELHSLGYAHSLEIWEDGALAGGVYGVALGGAFFGESMFSYRRDGSKIALACLVPHLLACGFELFDTQFITPHLESMGGLEISRAAYLALLDKALARPADIRARPLRQPQEVIQRITQTS
jgi:leucyl/phenylalanyl-tRNA--protein transferase